MTTYDYTNKKIGEYPQGFIDHFQNRYKTIEKSVLNSKQPVMMIGIEGTLIEGLNGKRNFISFYQTIPVFKSKKYPITFNQHKMDIKDENRMSVSIDKDLDISIDYNPFWQMPRDKMVPLKWQGLGPRTPYLFSREIPLSKNLIKKLTHGEEHLESLVHNQGIFVAEVRFPIDRYL